MNRSTLQLFLRDQATLKSVIQDHKHYKIVLSWLHKMVW